MIDWGRFSTWDNKIVLFSGGKDSLVTLHLVKSHYDDTIALFSDTSFGFWPEQIEYMQEVCDQLNVELVIVKPKEDFKDIFLKWGFPTPRKRWCCRKFKLEPMKDYLIRLDGSKVLFDGRRASESKWRRAWFDKFLKAGSDPAISWHHYFKCFSISPIWDWSDQQVKEYIQKYNLPINPLYCKQIHHMACPCGAYATIREMKGLRVYNPELFQTLVKIESKMRKGGSFIYRGKGRRYHLKRLLKQKLIEDFL